MMDDCLVFQPIDDMRYHLYVFDTSGYERVNIHHHDWVHEGPLWSLNIAYNLSNEQDVVIEISSDEEYESDN